MGNLPQVHCHDSVESPSEPGFQSVLSESLEEHCTAEAFYDALWGQLRAPVTPVEMYLVKEVQVVDHGDEEFTIKVIFDGVKLKSFGLAQEAKDYCKLHQHVVGNRRDRSIVAEDFKNGAHTHTSFSRLHAGPLRLEHYRVVDGERKAGPLLAKLVETSLVAPALAILAKRKVMVRPNHVSSLHGGGPSAITDSLDELFTFDMAWDFFLEALQNPLQFPGQETQLTELEDGWELVFFEHEKLKELNLARDSGLPSRDVRYVGRADREKREVVVVCSVGHELLFTSFSHFHLRPLRLESWQLTEGKRLGGAPEAAVLQAYLDLMVAKTEGAEGWYF